MVASRVFYQPPSPSSSLQAGEDETAAVVSQVWRDTKGRPGLDEVARDLGGPHEIAFIQATI
jgi:hypothetical protein